MTFKGIKGDVWVYTYPLRGIPEIVKQNRDGSFTVLIDESLNREQQLNLVAHALNHIAHEEDWIPGRDVDEIEVRCNAQQKSGRTIRVEGEDIEAW